MTCILATRGGDGELWLFETKTKAISSVLSQPDAVVFTEPRDLLENMGRRDLPHFVRKTGSPSLIHALHDRAIELALAPSERLTKRERLEIATAIWPHLLRAALHPPKDPVVLSYIAANPPTPFISERKLSGVTKMTELSNETTADTSGDDAAPAVKRERKPNRKRHSQNSTITVLVANPKRPGSAAATRFDLYTNGMTIAEYLEAGGFPNDLRWDEDKKFIEITSVEA